MPRKRHKPEEIVAKLRQVDVLVSQGQSVADAVRSLGVTEMTYYGWRQEFGGLKSDQVKRLKDLETENQRLRNVEHIVLSLKVSERRACRALGQHRST
jgi:transposase-like protein